MAARAKKQPTNDGGRILACSAVEVKPRNSCLIAALQIQMVRKRERYAISTLGKAKLIKNEPPTKANDLT